MVEFYGRYDLESSSKATNKKIRKIGFGIMSVLAVVVGVLVVLYFLDMVERNVLVVPLILTLFVAIGTIGGPIIIKDLEKQGLKSKPIVQITIENGIIVQKFISDTNPKDFKVSTRRKAEDAQEVIDTGDSYHIVFFTNGTLETITCQKELLVKGTLKEFEELFMGKIKIDKDKWKNEYDRNSER